MKKRITSVLLALALCLTLLPTAALAAEGDNVDHDPHAGIALTMQDNNLMKDSSTWTPDTISPPSITGYKGYLFDGGTYYLNENLTLAYPIAIKGNVKLCLNGHTITYAGDNESAISLENFGDDSTAHLTLTDCSTGADHLGTISGGKGKVVMMQGPSQLDMYGGIITGSKGNGVLVSSECTFNMYGGKITGNGGWGVDISEGKFDMSGGTITGNTSYGVHVGPYNNDNSNVFNVSGKATITGNGTEGTAKNVYLGKDQTIHVTGEFTGTIGVTAQNPSAETPIVTPNRIGFNQGTFTSDDGAYGIDSADDNSGIVKLKAHEWKYALKSGSKDTITATCDCGAEGGSVTIKAPDADKLTYDGTAKEATLVPNGWRGADVDNSMITYRYNSGDSTYRPTDTTTDAGEYMASIKLGNGTPDETATVEYEIKQATLTAGDFNFKAPNSLFYNGKVPDLNPEKLFALRSGRTGYGTITAHYYLENGGSDEVTPCNAGTYTVKISVAEGTNFKAVTEPKLTNGSWKFTIQKDTPTIEVTETNPQITKGQPMNISDWAKFSSNTDEDAKLTYTLDGDPTGIKLEGTKLTAENNASTAPTFNIKVTAEETKNFHAPVEVTIPVKVQDKAPEQLPGRVTQSDMTYGDGVLPDPVYTKPTGTTEVTITYTGTLRKDSSEYNSTQKPTEAGAYTVTVTCKTSTDVYTGTTTFTIAPKSIEDMTVALKENEFVYNGTEQSVTVESVGELTAADYTVTDDNAATNVGTYTVTVTGKGNYGGETKATWTIAPKELTVQSATVNFKTYDGTKNADVSEVKFNGLVDDTLIRSTDYAVKAEFDSADAADSCTATVTVTLKDTIAAKNYTLTNTDCKGSAAIKKASQTVTIPSGKSITKNGVGVDISTWASAAGVPGGSEPGKLTYSLTGGAYNGVTLDGTVLTVQKEATAESIIIKVQAADTKNYEASEGKTFTVTVTNKETVEISVTYADKTYDGKAIAPAGTLTVEGDKVPAKDLEVLYESTDGKGYNKTEAPKDAGAYKVTYKVADSNENYTGSVTRAFTISPRKVTVAPADKNMTKGSAIPTFELTSKDLVAGDTLKPNKAPKFSCFEKDNVAVSTSTAAGTYTITWTNMDGTTFDNGNYTVTTSATGTLTISNRSSGGGSSSDRDSHDSNPVIKTETKNNADGSTTKTETRKDGSVTQTTTGKDGSVSKTETKKDGSSVTENKAADGSTGTVKTDKNGQTEAKTALSNKAIEDAKKSGEAVKAPVEVKATKNSSTAPTVKVELPKNSGETKVEIPVSNVKPGTVAVLVHPDGTEEIVKNSLPTEDGIQLTVNGSATVKIVDNSKDFVDTRNHWAREEIDFVSARELVNGISATRYAPDATATRAQLWTILARQNDTDLSGGANWYEKAQLWSKDKGISDGTNPNGTINRAQMVTMLWRTMGQPAAGGSASFADVPADSYYAQAVAWAIENGITAGVGGGRFDPNSTCTRAQIATFLARSMK